MATANWSGVSEAEFDLFRTLMAIKVRTLLRANAKIKVKPVFSICFYEVSVTNIAISIR